MKKTLAMLLAVMMLLSFSACDGNQPIVQNSETYNQTQTPSNSDPASTNTDANFSTDISSIGSIEELEGNISKDSEDAINALNTEWQALSETITTYDEYLKNVERVEAFYEKINNNTEQLCVRLQEYALKYAELIMSSDMSNDDKYDDFDDLKDCIYDDATDDLKKGIYDGLLEDMQDALYDEVLDDSEDADSYSEWYDTRSDEYENWYDTRSDVYEHWYDTRSDIYSFYYDMRGELWSDDIERAEELMENFKQDIDKLKSK